MIDRQALFQTLSALPAPQFEQLRFALNPPAGIVPEGVAAQGNRVSALLSWVEGPTGCGLDPLGATLERLYPGVLNQAPTAAAEESVWNLPYPRNPYFTGRESILATLHQILNDTSTAAISQTQAISGLGGIGKTQTAVEYAYRYRDDYRFVFWVRADTELELIDGYVTIAQRLSLPLKDAENSDDTVQSVRRWLLQETGWLLIFDNADRPDIAQPFLPREITGHVLITSRAQDMQALGIVQPLEMATLSPDDAVAFLLHRVQANICPTDPEHIAATKLAADLGYLPLALEQAAAYIVTTRARFADYLNSYRKQRLKRLEKGKPKLGSYPDSIATTWALNLKQVQTTAPAAGDLLRFSAFLHPDAIPFALFTQAAAELGEPLATALEDAADDPLDFYDLLTPLGRYSLIRVDTENHSFSLHRLVQEVIRAELGNGACQRWVEPLFKAMNWLLPDKENAIDYKDWPTLAPLVNHVQELAQHCHRDEYESVQAADAFHTLGAYLLERGKYALADSLLQQALKLRQSLLGEEHEDIAASLDRAARSHELQGRYGEAKPLYSDALALRKRLLGEAHLQVSDSLNGLANLYSNQGHYSEAESLYQEALALRKQLLGEAHPHVATSLNNLALLYQDQGRYNEAETLYQEALALRKRLLGEAHPHVATSLDNLAGLYRNQERYDEAEPLCQAAFALRKRLLGEGHPHTAGSLNNLALLYHLQGRTSKAKPLFEATVALCRELLGDNHPDLAAGLNNLARCYRENTEYDRAEALCQEALAIADKILPEGHQDKGRFLDDFATLRAAQDRTEEARSLYEQALAILDAKLGPEHPWTVRCRENLEKLDE